MDIGIAHGHDSLVLGAFGCGAFRNPPAIVAKVFYDVMQDFMCCFETIEYAVYHTEREVENYEAFREQMGKAVKSTYDMSKEEFMDRVRSAVEKR